MPGWEQLLGVGPEGWSLGGFMGGARGCWGRGRHYKEELELWAMGQI